MKDASKITSLPVLLMIRAGDLIVKLNIELHLSCDILRPFGHQSSLWSEGLDGRKTSILGTNFVRISTGRSG